jgi:hypothetical protein
MLQRLALPDVLEKIEGAVGDVQHMKGAIFCQTVGRCMNQAFTVPLQRGADQYGWKNFQGALPMDSSACQLEFRLFRQATPYHFIYEAASSISF